MKTFIINGSYHKEGMTSSLVQSFVKGIGRSKTVFLMDEKFEYCKGCGSCLKYEINGQGDCDIEDAAKGWIDEMKRSDVIVLATPVYMFAPTAIMKKFMERNLQLFTGGPPRPRIKKVKGRTGVIILSSGAPFPFNRLFRMTSYPVRIMKFLLKGYGCSRIYILRAGGMELNKKHFKKWNHKARRLGKKIRSD